MDLDCVVTSSHQSMLSHIVACIQAASSLGKEHKFNLLFLYILCLAKYPTAVKMLGARLSNLPAKFLLEGFASGFGEVFERMVHHQRY